MMPTERSHAPAPKDGRQFLRTFLAATLILAAGSTTPASPNHDRVGNRSSPPPSEFQIGGAVAPINYYMTAWTVSDLFKMAGFGGEIGDTRPSWAWVPIVDHEWAQDRADEIPTDAHGWPTSLSLSRGGEAQRLTTIILANDRPGSFPAGTYRVLYDGRGKLTVDRGGPSDRVRPGRLRFDYDGSGEIFLNIEQTDPEGTGDYIRNIRVLRPDAEPGQPFTAAYLDDIRGYTVIRPLHLLGDQLTYGPGIPWDARKPLTHSHWGGNMGTPYEVAIDLANESDSDLWLNVPIAADGKYMRRLAELCEARLDPARRLYVELGNEIWNWAYPFGLGREYARERARERWPGVEGTATDYSRGAIITEPMMTFSWQGARTVEMGEIFRAAFADDKDRVIVVLCGQAGASQPYYHPSRYLLESPVWVGEEAARPAGEQVDAFGIAAYVHDPNGNTFSTERPEAYIRDAARWVRGEPPFGPDAEEPGLRHMLQSDRALAAAFGLPLVAYEGGQHFTGSTFTRDRVNTHPAMTDLYRTLFDVWHAEGGGLFVHFAGIIPRGRNEPGEPPTYHQSENFGIKELQTQTEADAPKWRALRARMRRLGQISGEPPAR